MMGKVVEVMAPRYIASKAPEIPAKNELMINAICLWVESLIPMASAAISSSRMALKALPYELVSSSTIMAIQTATTINGT